MNRLEREVVREIGAYSYHRFCVICHEFTTTHRQVHKEETAKDTGTQDEINARSALRYVTRFRVTSSVEVPIQGRHAP